MKIRNIVTVVALALIGSFIIPRTALATSAITIEGIVYDKTSKPVAGAVVVAWCGGVSFFGGSGTTDASGHYVIHTNSDDCPFDNELTVTTDIDGDGRSDGATHTQVHTSTFISIHLGDYTSVVIPEYDWLAASAAGIVGMGIIGFVRRGRLSSTGF